MTVVTFNPITAGEVTRDDSPGATFSSIRGGQGNSHWDTGTTARVQIGTENSTNNFDKLVRSIYIFDTSSIPANAVISSAVLKIKLWNKRIELGDTDIVVDGVTPSSYLSLANSDYNIGNYDGVVLANRIAISSLSVGAYNNFTLNASGIAKIDKAGYTALALRLGWDFDNSFGGVWSAWDHTDIFTYTHLSAGNEPELEITYTLDPVEVTDTGSGLDTISVVNPNAGVYANGYSYRKKITVDSTHVYGSSNHSNFPLLVKLTDNDLKNVANSGKVQDSTHLDIRFEDGSGQLDHEIERYDGVTGELIAWVRIPTLHYNIDDELYLYFGKSGLSATEEDVDSTWRSEYEIVYHMNDDNTDTTVEDFSSA